MVQGYYDQALGWFWIGNRKGTFQVLQQMLSGCFTVANNLAQVLNSGRAAILTLLPDFHIFLTLLQLLQSPGLTPVCLYDTYSVSTSGS